MKSPGTLPPQPPARPRRRVALIIETSIHYGREVLSGITRYLHSHQPWSVFLEQRELWTAPPQWLDRWRGDGVICRKTTPELLARFRRLGVPVIDLGDRCPNLGAPRIESDQNLIGRLAADHLLERGFDRFAFCGFVDQEWSVRRRKGFVDRLTARRFACEIYESVWTGPGALTWDNEQAAIAAWVEKLRRPVGVMACNDMRGQHVLDACQRLDLAVPEEAAVVGVDDDALLCNLCHPPLTSIVPNARQVGYEAAALLDRLMSGEKVTQPSLELPPVGVATRQSTDVLAIDDPGVAGVLRFIRERAYSGCSMKDVVKHAGMSRSVLERKFRQYLGHSPQQEIRSVQLKRVKQLLADSDLALSEIARLCGYDHPEYMNVVFKRELGVTPGQWRRSLGK